MWFAVWEFHGAKSQLTVEVRQYTSSAKTAYETLRTYSDPSGTPPLADWFTFREANIPHYINVTGFLSFGESGINGFLYYPSPHNACSEVDMPPASNNSDTVWLAIISGYPTCTPENIMFLNTAGYRVMITYSHGDVNRVPPSTNFPVAIVTEEFANFLIQNATVTSADSLITVHVVSNRPRQYVIMVCISLAFCLVALLLLSVLWDFLKRSNCNSDKRDVSENRNPNTTRQQQQLRYRSREHSEREEQQNSRPERSEGIELRHQQEEGRRVRSPDAVLARQSLSETRQHQETTQQRQQEGVGRQQNDNRQQRYHNRPQLLEERRSREATQQNTSNSQQMPSREPLYGNVRPSSNGHRQFNIQTESCRACPICLVDFNNGETVRVLPCDPDHIFHNACLQQWFTTNIHRECPVCRQSATERTTQPQETEHRRQQSTQQQQQRRHMRPPNTVLANLSGRARQSLSETRQHHETTQQRQQEGVGRQQNDNRQQRYHNRPQLLEERRSREATQQNTSNSQQMPSREPLYGNVRPSSNGHRQFNIQTESCRACPICLVDFNNGETVRVLPCDPDHIFHDACLQQWFTTNIHRESSEGHGHECPVCRSPTD